MKIVVYLYNYIFNTMVLGNINSNIISLNDSILNDTGVDCFSLTSYREYLYLRMYGYRVYIYIP